jgi:hypothetical protein
MFNIKSLSRLVYIAVFLACTNNLLAQVHLLRVPNSKLPSERGDAIKVDTLKSWNYQFDDSKKSESTDSVQRLGFLTFLRIRQIVDSTYFNVYHQYWKPHMTFNIFNLSDSAYVKKQFIRTMMLSSCVGPEVGGDYFIIGKYIFANFSVCLNCAITGIDYCRPLINFVINRVDIKRAETLDEIFNQFVINPVKKSK